MKRILYFLMLSLSLVSCKDDFDISKLRDSAKLVVYSFPTEGDSTLVIVTKSVPVSTAKGFRENLVSQTVDAHIIYKVNGIECPVKRIESEEESFHFCSSNILMIGQYYAVGHQKSGDNIQIEVSADGFQSVSASTYIPQSVDIQVEGMSIAQEKKDYFTYQLDNVLASFQDNGSSRDYYSVKVKRVQVEGKAMYVRSWYDGVIDTVYAENYKDYQGHEDFQKRNENYFHGIWNFDSLHQVCYQQMLDTDKEPLLNKSSQLDDDLGFDGYEYFDNAYIFNDQQLNGQKYTLHLAMLNSNYIGSDYYDQSWDGLFGYGYQVDLYKVTPEYYRFLSSINNASSNDWAEAGIMQITPTYSNVKGGYGVVAGFNVGTSFLHVDPPKNSDNLYHNVKERMVNNHRRQMMLWDNF